MTDGLIVRLDRFAFRAFLTLVVIGAGAALVLPTWLVPAAGDSKYWNGLVAFALLGIACDSTFLQITRISFANISSSIVFVPLFAAILLFDHPWPAVIAGVAAFVVEAGVQKKPFVRVLFNTAQYMLGVALAGVVYVGLGGRVGLDRFSFSAAPFVGLVVTFFVVNQLSVSLAIVLTTGVSLREAWARIAGSALLYDFIASTLAILLAFLYIKYQFLGLAVLILPLFLVRHMYQMTQQFERVNRELLELMVKAIEARDPYTSGHSLRVSEYAKAIARELGLSAKQLDQIASAALMHDVGKIYEEFAPILRKEGKLTTEERVLMQKHPLRSAELAATIGEFRGAVEAAIRHHHENYDGTGYPSGIAGDEIPLGARIIMIADTMDAMTTDRPYRKALSLARTLEELRKYSSRQFDPHLVDVAARSPALRRLLGPQLVVGVTSPEPQRAAGGYPRVSVGD